MVFKWLQSNEHSFLSGPFHSYRNGTMACIEQLQCFFFYFSRAWFNLIALDLDIFINHDVCWCWCTHIIDSGYYDFRTPFACLGAKGHTSSLQRKKWRHINIERNVKKNANGYDQTMSLIGCLCFLSSSLSHQFKHIFTKQKQHMKTSDQWPIETWIRIHCVKSYVIQIDWKFDRKRCPMVKMHFVVHDVVWLDWILAM